MLFCAFACQVTEVSVRYDGPSTDSDSIVGRCVLAAQDPGPRQCGITMRVPRRMTPPIHVYYQLDNFYQNHREYVGSRSNPQLSGTFPNADVTNCGKATTLDVNGVIKKTWPCGRVAKSMFNGTPVWHGQCRPYGLIACE